MYCPNCGKELPGEGAVFCPFCGERLPRLAQAPVDAPQPQPKTIPLVPQAAAPRPDEPVRERDIPAEQPEAPRKRSRAGLIVGCIAGGLLLVALAVLLLVILPEQRRVQAYNEAVDLLDANQFTAAADRFGQLGGYADAEEMAAYATAREAMRQGNYQNAADGFAKLGDFMDAPAQLASARGELLYADGVQALQNGAYEEALAALEQIPDLRDAGELARQCRDQLSYAEAQSLFSAGSYGEALALLEGISDMPEADDLKDQCQNWLTYTAAMEQFEAGSYADALAQLENVHDIPEAEALKKTCADKLTYATALGKYETGDYAGAVELLKQIPDMDEAAELLQECRKQNQYSQIKAALDKKDWANALALLNDKLAQGYPDRSNLIRLCQNHAKYAEAVRDLAAGKNYSAYQAFIALGDFEDAAAKAKSCIVSKPQTGEVYRNSSYSKKDCQQRIVTPNDGYYTYVKIYCKRGTLEELVSCIFIHPGKTAKIYLPAGDYIFKVAYGKGNWFGTTDMFGDEGSYQRVGGKDYVLTRKKLSSNQYYNLELRVGSGGNMGSASENRDGF